MEYETGATRVPSGPPPPGSANDTCCWPGLPVDNLGSEDGEISRLEHICTLHFKKNTRNEHLTQDKDFIETKSSAAK